MHRVQSLVPLPSPRLRPQPQTGLCSVSSSVTLLGHPQGQHPRAQGLRETRCVSGALAFLGEGDLLLTRLGDREEATV